MNMPPPHSPIPHTPTASSSGFGSSEAGPKSQPEKVPSGYRMPASGESSREQNKVLKDRLIEKIETGEGFSEVKDLIELRKSRGLKDGLSMMMIMASQKHHLLMALYRIEKKYPGLEPEEREVLKKLAEQTSNVDHIDDFVLHCSKFSLVTTFLHQKYHGSFPDKYWNVGFKEGVTCKQVFDLPYFSIINDPKTFRTELSRCANPINDGDYVFRVDSLSRLLKEGRPLVLYPEFDVLEEPFFLQCIPQGFYPLGLTEEPFVMADGWPHSPAQFFFHDMAHAALIQGFENKVEETRREKDVIYLKIINGILEAIKPKDEEMHDSLVRVLVCKNHEYGKTLYEIFTTEVNWWEEVFNKTTFNSIKSKKDIEAYLWLNDFIRFIRGKGSPEAILQMKPDTLLSEYQHKYPVSEDDVMKLFAWKKLSRSCIDDLRLIFRNCCHWHDAMNRLSFLPAHKKVACTLDSMYSEQEENVVVYLKQALASGNVQREKIPREFLEYYSEKLGL